MPDLVSACIFCGGLLLAGDLPEPAGSTVEVAFSYSDLGRSDDAAGVRDSAGVTARFLSVGLGMARAARNGLGAGTPVWEWRLKFALAGSHDDQTQRGGTTAAPRTEASGRGRFENYLLLYRHPLGLRDSVEVAWSGRSHTASGVVSRGEGGLLPIESRALTAERTEVTAGWRHRWPSLEVLAGAGFVQPSGSHATAGAFYISDGKLWSGSIEGRARRGAWSIMVAAQAAFGSIDVSEQSAPDFRERDSSVGASLGVYRIGAGWTGRRTEAFLAAAYDRSHLPFVSMAALGAEVASFEEGLHPDSQAHQWQADLTVRHAVSSVLRPHVALRWARGIESVTLTDPSGATAAQTLSVRRAGRLFGRPVGDVSLTVGARIAVLPRR